MRINSKFGRDIITLVSGTAVAHAIPLALAPILTRIYTPADFGILAIYTSAATILTVFASLKYDLAIVLPKSDTDAANITVLCILLATSIALILFFLILIFNQEITSVLTDGESEAKEIAKWLYFVPVSVFFMGIFNALSFWFNRKEQYKVMAASKVVYSLGNIGLQLASGSIGYVPKGLLLGFLGGRFAAILFLWQKFRVKWIAIFKEVGKSGMLRMLTRYKRFPQFTLPAELLNVVSNQIPVLIIGKIFGGVVLGNYYLRGQGGENSVWGGVQFHIEGQG